jgi:hypothetical protein
MTTENRSLRFQGTAFGTNVSLKIELNGKTIYDDIVSSIDIPVPPPPVDAVYATALLVQVDNIADLPTTFRGSLPMSTTVTGGHGVVLTNILSNFQGNTQLANR